MGSFLSIVEKKKKKAEWRNANKDGVSSGVDNAKKNSANFNSQEENIGRSVFIDEITIRSLFNYSTGLVWCPVRRLASCSWERTLEQI